MNAEGTDLNPEGKLEKNCMIEGLKIVDPMTALADNLTHLVLATCC